MTLLRLPIQEMSFSHQLLLKKPLIDKGHVGKVKGLMFVPTKDIDEIEGLSRYVSLALPRRRRS